ncbi:MAG: dUTP diphosphatase [Phoenicibacter congonensis]|uniref:dUTP diphosphatase n=1 Tax=Phoenicibacter congonensis TaxID=1944646 RepID=A0AA43RI93_9ACTN|nr:dUTP diphosphatase [Phoenicibacter congonensis]
MKINIKKLRDNAVIPARGSDSAAGCDLYACLNHRGGFTIQPNQTVKVNTGIAVEIPDGYFGAIFARSGLATNKGLRPANCVGVVDSDYRGEIIVALHNDTDAKQTFGDGERIAQLVIIPYLPVEFNEVDELDETVRGAGGFGSTGTTTIETKEPEYEQLSLFDNE